MALFQARHLYGMRKEPRDAEPAFDLEAQTRPEAEAEAFQAMRSRQRVTHMMGNPDDRPWSIGITTAGEDEAKWPFATSTDEEISEGII